MAAGIARQSTSKQMLASVNNRFRILPFLSSLICFLRCAVAALREAKKESHATAQRRYVSHLLFF
jgi:hypothetical protein